MTARGVGGRTAAWLAGLDDGTIMRAAFFSLLAGTLGVLYVDYSELTAGDTAAFAAPLEPILPPANPEAAGDGTVPAIVSEREMLDGPLAIELSTGGELRLTGTFDPGSAERFAAEIATRGEYVETVVLESPGGSVTDALAIGALIHERGFATRVDAGRLCASSCPIVFASGAERIAGPDAAIGVHQVYASAVAGDPRAVPQAGEAMSRAQTMTAEITRHLSRTGVDPALWLHALETAPDRLYYFSGEEMATFNLVTRLPS
jgi:hypothetical protein